MRLASFLLLLVLLGCATVGPAEDFPVLPLPQPAVEEPVEGTRVEGGIFFPDTEFEKLNRNLQLLKAERDELRRIIEAYNEWVRENSTD